MNARAPILALKDVRLKDGPVMLFDGVDLALEPRVRASLVGRNGAGKSTLMRILNGRVEPDDGDRFASPGLRIAVVAQEPEIAGETLLDYASAGGAERHEAEAHLETFGLDPSKPATGLSGGETRRAALARAFAEDPDVILLDEPTNHLDILAIETLEEELKASRAAALIVSHDRAFLERVTQRCFWLENRRVRRLDKGFADFDAWAEGLLAQEAEEARRLDKQLEREEHWLRRGVTARRARNEGRRRKLLDLREEKRQRMRQAQGPASMAVDAGGASGQRVVEAKGLSKRFGERTLLANFSTRITRGDRVAIVGPNGAGKTTLVKLLCGLYQPAGGRILIDGQDLAGLDPGSWRSRVAILFQDFHRIELTLRESIGHGGIARAGDTGAVAAAAEEARANRVLRAVPGGLNGYVGHSCADGTELSGGQRHPPRAHDRPRAVRRTVHPPGPRLPSARPFPLTPVSGLRPRRQPGLKGRSRPGHGLRRSLRSRLAGRPQPWSMARGCPGPLPAARSRGAPRGRGAVDRGGRTDGAGCRAEDVRAAEVADGEVGHDVLAGAAVGRT